MATTKTRRITQEAFELLKSGKPVVVNLVPRPKLGGIFTVIGLTDTETLEVRCSQHGGFFTGNCGLIKHEA